MIQADLSGPALRRAALLLVALSALSACTSAPTRAPATSPSKPGGYYLDDGPGDHPPPNLDKVADAQPRLEPIKPSASRPYTVFGRTYVPMTELAPYKARGTASWYGKRYHGQATSSGEIYDMYAMTAAHCTLPIPSYVRVTNVRTNRSVVVRINDRGPFRSDRLIDLSYVAAYKLGIINAGSDLVEVESIVPGAMGEAGSSAPATATTAPAEPIAQEPAGAYVQLGAFATRQNAESFLTKVRGELTWLSDTIALYGREGMYRVHAGPYADRDAATRVAERIEQSSALRPVIIQRQAASRENPTQP